MLVDGLMRWWRAGGRYIRCGIRLPLLPLTSTQSTRLQILLQSSTPITTFNNNSISTNQQLSPKMPIMRKTHPTHTTTRATRSSARPSLKTRIMGPKRATRAHPAPVTTTTTTTKTTRTTGHGHGHGHATAAPVHHHKRKTTVGDKVSGALMKLRGSLTHRPGLKAAGTRRMHGTDGRNARRVV
jgi:hypothetical protein